MRVAVISFIVAGLFLSSSGSLAAQELGIAAKDPQVAQAYAWLCPGCGHLYSGEATKGALIATVSVGSLLGGAAVQLTRKPEVDCTFRGDRFDCVERNTDFTPLMIGGAISVATYLYGLIDAGPSVRRMQARSELDLGRVQMSPAISADGAAGAQVAVRLTLRP
jgi:hypothetical protein